MTHQRTTMSREAWNSALEPATVSEIRKGRRIIVRHDAPLEPWNSEAVEEGWNTVLEREARHVIDMSEDEQYVGGQTLAGKVLDALEQSEGWNTTLERPTRDLEQVDWEAFDRWMEGGEPAPVPYATRATGEGYVASALALLRLALPLIRSDPAAQPTAEHYQALGALDTAARDMEATLIYLRRIADADNRPCP